MNKFGGLWTEIKLEAVRRYLKFYCQALKNQHFDLIYIDVRAGSGKCQISEGIGDTLIDGSAKIALDTDPGFQEFHFIEEDPINFQELQNLSQSYPDKNINLHNEDANEVISNICSSINWKKNRAVIFIDPYGLEIKWPLIETIAKTEAMDVWYFFPLSGIYRQAARQLAAVDEGKEKLLTEVLGTSEWKNAFYEQTIQSDFFDVEESMERTAELNDIVQFIKEERLGKTFSAVRGPRLLPDSGGPKRFALFFAVANPNKRAIQISTDVADYILNMQ